MGGFFRGPGNLCTSNLKSFLPLCETILVAFPYGFTNNPRKLEDISNYEPFINYKYVAALVAKTVLLDIDS